MNAIKKFLRKPIGKVLILVVVLIVSFQIKTVLTIRGNEQVSVTMRNANYAPNVSKKNKLLQKFQINFKDTKVLLACEEDVTGDELKDLVVIYQKQKQVQMVTVIGAGQNSGYRFSKPVPGPKENQKIQFRNIDKEGVIEFIISGEKKGATGYAIYRMIEDEPVDLFGEGMEDCC